MRKIFITGITGFVGRHLLPLLSSEDEIYLLVNNLPLVDPPEFKLPNVKIIRGSLRRPAYLFKQLMEIKPEICIHLAWWQIPDFNSATCFENLKMSTDLFLWLVEYCECKKIISTGSNFEYGRNFGSCYESNHLEIKSHFAWAKHSISDYGFMLAKKYAINFMWARIFYVYGSGQRSGSLIPTTYNALKSGNPLVIKTPHSENDFVHVSDVSKALIQILGKEVVSGIFNIGSGESFPVWKIVEYVEKAMGKGPEASTFLRSHEKPVNTLDTWADISLSRNVLGWEPKIKIEEGIRDYIKNAS